MRIAVFGGSFDPVHRGHVAVADAAQQELAPDLLLWVPARHAPHKPGRAPAAPEDRLELVRRVVAGRENEAVSTLELGRPGPSYTVDTLRALLEQHPDAELTVLLGADSLDHLPTWRDLPGLLALAGFALVPRPGHGEEALARLRARLGPALAARLRARFLPMDEVPISSTEVRRRLASGGAVEELVPAAVAEVIRRRGLYCSTS